MTDAELKQWQSSIYTDPQSVDISKLPPAEYKFLDQYRELMCEYKAGTKTTEECQTIGKLLRNEYDNNCTERDRGFKAMQSYQENIKATDDLLSTILTTDAMSMAETLQCLCAYVSHERGEDVSAKAILRRYKLDYYDTWHALSERQRVSV